MSARAHGALAVVAAVVVAALFGPGAGCSVGADATQPHAASDASVDCPATLGKANDVACADEGETCPVVVDCEVTFELVQCTCHASRWRCSDTVGPLEAGVAPRCVAPAPPSKEPCPSSIRTAQGTACDDFGRQCFYKGDLCDSGITLLDPCACGRGAGGALAYACRRLSCSPPIELDH